MNNVTLIVGGSLALVVLVSFLLVAFRSQRSMTSIDDFFIFNRKLKDTGVFSSTFSAEMSLATVFIAFLTLASVLGLNLFLAMLTFVAGQFSLWLLIPFIKEKVFWGETLQGYLGEAYSSNALRFIASVASIVGLLGLFATEILVGSSLLNGLMTFQASHILIVALVASLVVFYTTLGGFKSVVTTDRWQTTGVFFIVAVLFFGALVLQSKRGEPLISHHFFNDYQFSWSLMLNFLIINTLYPLCDTSAWQRVAAARDTSTARHGFLAATISFLVTWTLIIVAALALVGFTQGETGGGALTKPLSMLADMGVVGAIIVGIALAALAAAMLSTGDTFLIAAAQTLSIDILYRDFFAKRRMSEQGGLPPETGLEGVQQADSNLPGHPSFLNETFAGTSSFVVLTKARYAIVIMAISGLGTVGLLQSIGFAVADLVFVIYGSTVAFLPSIIGAFGLKAVGRRQKLGVYAVASLALGVGAGWLYGVMAVVGVAPVLPVLGAGSAYNSPSVALFAASVIYLVGLVITRAQTDEA